MAARTLDQIVQEQLGAFLLQILRLTAELEAVREQLAALQPPTPPATPEAPSD